MSTTTQDQTPESSPAQNKIALEKKKLKVLKNALKQERQERVLVEKELEVAQKNIEALKVQLNDKEQRYLQLYQESVNLQEALVRESKGGNIQKSKTQGPKAPLLFTNPPTKKQSEQAILDQKGANSETLDMLNAKIRGLEEGYRIKDEDYNVLKRKVDEQVAENNHIRQLYDAKIIELIQERDFFAHEVEAKDKEIQSMKEQYKGELEKQTNQHQCQVKQLQDENEDLIKQRNQEMDRNLKIEETIDEKNDKILQLEKELQRKVDEVNLRKEIIESMQESLMRHEKESAELASKLVLMKNQIMEHNVGRSLQRKFAGVKSGALKGIPVVVSLPYNYPMFHILTISLQFEFREDINQNYFLLIDSKSFSLSINFEDLDFIGENKEGKLQIVYFVSSKDSNQANFKKQSEIYECCENEEMIQTYQNIRNQVQINETRGHRFTQSFSGNSFHSKSMSPLKKGKKTISEF
ncbi:UNKNOWN [Stylonychia lemnae]|uniref:Uncharacterized protein n=1 Tax=Stylonychia lemnae TaxID=5949 RepID=A0A078B2U9_STYLE|nr:UNKNOWN [Stylonychia lemnae]|eukprot:CDW87547.1 UNKNOWN [Stylonychia lemnae]